MTVLRDAPPPVETLSPPSGAGPRSQRLLAIGILCATALLDQTTKWWAWQHAHAVLNQGATWFLGSTVSSWYADPHIGAALDVISLETLAVAVVVLLRRRQPTVVLVAATLMIAGWGSNLLDRLGLHTVTAPASPRGAIDFLHLGSYAYNVADVCIATGTALALLAPAVLLRRRRPEPARSGTPASPYRPGARVTTGRRALASVFGPVLVLAAVGHRPAGVSTPAAPGGVAWSEASPRRHQGAGRGRC